ncbi:MAG TPA: peptide deformylase [Planctomycetota bacterium]|nr:peptide deformylase [Planctomycetota bacterium]
MDLILYPNPVLRRRAPPLLSIDEGVREKARQMLQIMYREKGVGLAAPQVHWSVRLFVVNPLGESDPSGERVYINPEITSSEGEVLDEEGCLSIPGVRGNVVRYQKVVIRALDLEGARIEESVADLHARILQHELDHLDGILFITRLGVSERMLAAKVLKKLEKDYKEGLASRH